MLGTAAGNEPGEEQGGMNCRESRIQPWIGKAPVASKALPPIEFDAVIRRRVSLEAKDRIIQEINSPDKLSPSPELQHNETKQRLDKFRCDFAAMGRELADLDERMQTLSPQSENFNHTLLQFPK